MVTLKQSLGQCIQFNSMAIYCLPIDTEERRVSYLLGRRVDFLSRHLNIMGYSFVCSLTYLDTDKMKENDDSIKKGFTIYIFVAASGYGPH